MLNTCVIGWAGHGQGCLLRGRTRSRTRLALKLEPCSTWTSMSRPILMKDVQVDGGLQLFVTTSCSRSPQGAYDFQLVVMKVRASKHPMAASAIMSGGQLK